MMKTIRSSETSALTRARGVTSQEKVFFIVTAGKPLNLTHFIISASVASDGS
jgi:hypothetical protein